MILIKQFTEEHSLRSCLDNLTSINIYFYICVCMCICISHSCFFTIRDTYERSELTQAISCKPRENFRDWWIKLTCWAHTASNSNSSLILSYLPPRINAQIQIYQELWEVRGSEVCTEMSSEITGCFSFCQRKDIQP